MTGSDLLVLAPWIVFAVALAAICLLLIRSRHESGSRPRRSPRPLPGPADPAGPDRPATRPDREPASCANPQEARCREKNAQARPQ
jgi:hypothetical protein